MINFGKHYDGMFKSYAHDFFIKKIKYTTIILQSKLIKFTIFNFNNICNTEIEK